MQTDVDRYRQILTTKSPASRMRVQRRPSLEILIFAQVPYIESSKFTCFNSGYHVTLRGVAQYINTFNTKNNLKNNIKQNLRKTFMSCHLFPRKRSEQERNNKN